MQRSANAPMPQGRRGSTPRPSANGRVGRHGADAGLENRLSVVRRIGFESYPFRHAEEVITDLAPDCKSGVHAQVGSIPTLGTKIFSNQQQFHDLFSRLALRYSFALRPHSAHVAFGAAGKPQMMHSPLSRLICVCFCRLVRGLVFFGKVGFAQIRCDRFECLTHETQRR